jgi:hypothetical protein
MCSTPKKRNLKMANRIEATEINVPGRNTFRVPGALSVDDAVAAFGDDLGLRGMTGSVVDPTGDSTTRVLNFAHKVGNKG